jgi:hypothetical protein
MKNFLKPTLIICFLIFINSCSKNESAIDLPKETIALEGELDINFEDLTAVTIDGESEVDGGGGFQSDVSTTLAEELPVLFTKDNDVIFGYYDKTGANNTVSIDDILLFYFTAHPEVAIQGLSNSVLLSKIKSNSNYTELKNMISASLDANISPFKNASFVELLNVSGYNLAIDTRGYKQAGTKGVQEFNFQFEFTRDGKVSWQKEFPLFATVGMQITDKQGFASSPYLFEQKGLVASPVSLLAWAYDYLTSNPKNDIESFQLPKDGEYTIAFTNGNGGNASKELSDKVSSENMFNVGVYAICLAMPIGMKSTLKDNECRNALITLFGNLAKEVVEVSLTSEFELVKFLDGLHNDIYDVVQPCVPDAKWNYLDKIRVFTKYFDLAEDTSEFILLLRDAVISNVYGDETRYFYNGISYGKLDLSNQSGSNNGVPTSQTEFVGGPDSEHIFKGFLSEEVFKYDITRNITSTIKKDIIAQNVANFPFIADKLSGDATQVANSSTTSTDTNGSLEMTFKMGTQDSQFEIKPAFDGKGLPESERIDLKPSGLKIGDFHEGGVIFYIDETGEHGLVCALQDQANEVEWGCDGQLINGAGGSAIGTGLQNTLDILAGCETAEIAARYAYSGSWFLPSYRELEEMAKNQQAIEETALANGGSSFIASFYYSSTQISSALVYLIHFGYDYSWGANPPPYYGYKTEQGPKWRKVYHVRAVKSF